MDLLDALDAEAGDVQRLVCAADFVEEETCSSVRPDANVNNVRPFDLSDLLEIPAHRRKRSEQVSAVSKIVRALRADAARAIISSVALRRRCRPEIERKQEMRAVRLAKALQNNAWPEI